MIHLALLSLLRRPLSRLLLMGLIALSCALPVFLLQTAGGLYAALNRAVEPFPILAGSPGSSYQLVLNTVFLRDRPLENLSQEEANAIQRNPKVAAAYPLAFGDQYRGFRLVGVDTAIFTYSMHPKEKPWLTVETGHIPEAEGDVVIGHETARLTGLTLGDTFQSTHGVAGKGRPHNHTYRVVGILAPLKGPYDTAILTDIHDIWEAHGKEAEAKQEVTALLVVPKGYKEAMQLLAEYQKKKEVQMVFPSQSIISLYAMVGQTKDFWKWLTVSMIGVSLLITLLVMYWSTLGRLSEIALLKALGAGKGDITRFLLTEEIALLFIGSLCGWLLGYGISYVAAGTVASRAAIIMPTAIYPLGLAIIPAITLIGTLASILPLWLIRRKAVAEYL